jgi:hypothetical protein
MYEYATTSDLEARWRPLTPDEASTAAVLLDDASSQIRTELPGIDARLDVSDDLRRNATRVVCAMVRRAMDVPDDAGFGIATVQETTGPFSRSFNYSNPTGDLYLTKAERRLLGGGVQRAGSIDTVPPGRTLWEILP